MIARATQTARARRPALDPAPGIAETWGAARNALGCRRRATISSEMGTTTVRPDIGAAWGMMGTTAASVRK